MPHRMQFVNWHSYLAPPPREVGLYGLGHYTQPILDLCRAAGLFVHFVVDDQPTAHPDYAADPTDLQQLEQVLRRSDVPLLSARTFFSRLQNNEIDFPLIASRIVTSPEGNSISTDSFLRSARQIREATDGRSKLLHPVILARLLPPVDGRRLTLFGFPGSGNILAKHLLREIWQRIARPIAPRAELFAAMARHYYRSTVALTWRVLQKLRPIHLELTPTQFPTLDLTASLESGEHVMVHDIPGHLHLDAVFNHLHAAPTAYALKEMTRLGAKCVVIIRHPCDVILSWASKLSRPPTPVLDHPQFLKNIAIKLTKWLQQVVVNEVHLTVVRYEDLITRQTDVLQAFARKVGVSLSEAEIEELFDRFLNRDLQPDLTPGHFYQGGAGKWRRHFLPRHLAILKAAGLDAACKRWGYDLTLEKSAASRSTHFDTGPTGQMGGAVPLERHLNIKESLFVREPSPLLATSIVRETDASIRRLTRTVRHSLNQRNRSLCSALNGSTFLDHLDSGGLGPNSPSWVAAIPWDSLLPIFHPEEFDEDVEETPELADVSFARLAEARQ